MNLLKKKLSTNLIYLLSVPIFLFPLSLIFSRAFTEILVIFLSLLCIFYFKKFNFLLKNKETKIDFFVILLMFFYLIINLFFTTKIELSIERAIPFVRWFFTLIVAYFFIKLSEKKFKFILKILTSNINSTILCCYF